MAQHSSSMPKPSTRQPYSFCSAIRASIARLYSSSTSESSTSTQLLSTWRTPLLSTWNTRLLSTWSTQISMFSIWSTQRFYYGTNCFTICPSSSTWSTWSTWSFTYTIGTTKIRSTILTDSRGGSVCLRCSCRVCFESSTTF